VGVFGAGRKFEGTYGAPDEVAWYGSNSADQKHPVGEKRANGFALYDMLGNVWEWVNDRYGENYYVASPPRDPQGPDEGGNRVLRGGSWFDPPTVVHDSYRYGFNPTSRDDSNGFRCVKEDFAP
jgi:formylglycine-generating enzyme required for sulfatase activity